MAERLKVRLSTFLACFIAIATAFVLVEGSGWQKKEQEWEWEEWQREKERDFGLLLSLGEVLPIQLYANSRPWGFRQPRSLKRKNEQLLNVFLRTSNPREAIKGSSSSHRQREPLHVPNRALLDPATHEQEDHIVSKIPLKGHDQRRINKTAITVFIQKALLKESKLYRVNAKPATPVFTFLHQLYITASMTFLHDYCPSSTALMGITIVYIQLST